MATNQPLTVINNDCYYYYYYYYYYYSSSQVSDLSLLEAVRDAMGVYYNYSGVDASCYQIRAGVNNESQLVE